MPITLPRPTSRRATVVALAAAAAGVGGLALPAASSARCVDDSTGQPMPCSTTPAKARAHGTVAVNPATTLGVRYTPVQRSKQFRQLKNGATVGIVCQTRGSRVTGTYGTTRIWNKLIGGGYVSDAYIYTGSDRRVAPKC